MTLSFVVYVVNHEYTRQVYVVNLPRDPYSPNLVEGVFPEVRIRHPA
jgi:hypothetical protein